MITLYGVSKGNQGIVTPGIPLVVPLPQNAVNQLEGGTAPAEAPAGQTSAYAPPGGAAFDGNEGTFVNFVTYAAGSSSSTYGETVTPVAVELVGSATPGYSFEPGWYGGSGSVTLDGITIIEFRIAASPVVQRWRSLVSGVSGTVLRINKPVNQRFRIREVYLYV